MGKGILHVTVENIFPIIKNLMSFDKEIFLREIISNSIDATIKVKKLFSLGKTMKNISNLNIDIYLNKKKKTLNIIDKGIGMSVKEVDKYINQIAFSSAEAYITRYKDKEIIGQFGLGFYSAFMVSEKVEIFSKSYIEDTPSSYWCSNGTPIFSLKEGNKKMHGTEIILHINKDSKEFLDERKINNILNKYCKFMPIPINFGYREDDIESIKIINIINNFNALWIKNPLLLREEDYKILYKKLYPYEMEDPLFWIHLNMDYPFHINGILYLPKKNNRNECHIKNIHIYSNKIYITDEIEGIVPSFLNVLYGIIDSVDIPLNSSRSSLQYNISIKKIYKYILKKAADKFYFLYKKNVFYYIKIWEEIKSLIEYGMISEEKFFETAKLFYLYTTVDGKYFIFDDLIKRIKNKQKNIKNNKIILLYSSNKEEQYNYINLAKKKFYEILILNSLLSSQFIQKIEVTYKNILFTRVDADTIDNIFKNEEITISKVPEIYKIYLNRILLKSLTTHKFRIILIPLESKLLPFMITNPEFMRRMKEMSPSEETNKRDSIPFISNLNININHEIIKITLKEYNFSIQNKIIDKLLYLAFLYKKNLSFQILFNIIESTIN